MNNEKQKKQDKLKDGVFKVLHVICYILSGLFLICLLISALQSCKHDSVSAETEVNASNDYVTLKYQGTGYEFTNEELVTLNTLTGTPNTEYSYSDFGNIINYYPFDLSSAKAIYNGEYIEATQLWASFSVYEMPNGDYYARLYKVFIYSEPNNRYIDLVNKTDNVGEGLFDSKYEFTTNDFYFCPPLQLTEKDQALFQYFFKNAIPKDFIFNKVFNYNAPMFKSIDGVYGSITPTATTPSSVYLDLDIGDFISNGQIYNKIRLYYFPSNGLSILIDGEIKDAPSGFYVYGMMYYYNTHNNTSVIVNYHNQLPYIRNGGNAFYYDNSSTWQLDAFRYITILGDISTSNGDMLNSFNNNNQNAYNGSEVGGEVNNVFTLVGSAFTGLLPILGIYILPSVTLGTLLFIPLVATLVFVIIKIIKK